MATCLNAKDQSGAKLRPSSTASPFLEEARRFARKLMVHSSAKR